MDNETIEVKTENGRILQVVVVSKSVDAIWVVLGEGLHNVRCKLVPTRNALAYAGSVMGRELVYERSVAQVRGDLVRHRQDADRFRPR
jgi:hypothetical protein